LLFQTRSLTILCPVENPYLAQLTALQTSNYQQRSAQLRYGSLQLKVITQVNFVTLVCTRD